MISDTLKIHVCSRINSFTRLVSYSKAHRYNYTYVQVEVVGTFRDQGGKEVGGLIYIDLSSGMST